MNRPERIIDLYIQGIQGYISLTSIWILTWLHKESPCHTVATSSYSILYPIKRKKCRSKSLTPVKSNHSPKIINLSLIIPCTSEASPKDQTNKWADCTMPEGDKFGAVSDHKGGEKSSETQNTLHCADFQKSSFSSSPSPFLLAGY